MWRTGIEKVRDIQKIQNQFVALQMPKGKVKEVGEVK